MEILKKDKKGNIIKGDVVDVECTNSFIMSDKKLVTTVGLNDLIVIDTPDALLVCPRDRVEEVKKLVDELRDRGLDGVL